MTLYTVTARASVEFVIEAADEDAAWELAEGEPLSEIEDRLTRDDLGSGAVTILATSIETVER